MRKIILKSIILYNFKGIEHLELDFDEGVTEIRGDNAAGKTTVLDGFTWCLFGKDSTGKADFTIKTLDKEGVAIPKIDHVVKVVLDVDGQGITFERTLREKWTRKRGSAKETFTGHETLYHVDNAPLSAGEYLKEVETRLLSEELLKLLTTPFAFATLKWEKRREILIGMCGGSGAEFPALVAEVLTSDKRLLELPDIINGRPFENVKNTLGAERKKINDCLKELPVRIDEAKRAIGVREFKPLEAYTAEIEVLEKSYYNLNLENSTKKAELERETRARAHRLKKADEADGKNRQILGKTSELKHEINEREYTLKGDLADIDRLTAELANLKDKYSEAKRVSIVDAICPTCGQELPLEQLEGLRARANAKRATNLAVISAEGENAHKRIQRHKVHINKLEGELKELNAALKALPPVIPYNEAEDEELQRLLAVPLPVEAGAEAKALVVGKMKQKLDALRLEYVEAKAYEDNKERQRALDAKLKGAQEDYEEIERKLYLLELYTVKKVELLENRINSKFSLARFKLFEQQVNGGIAECCTVLYDGVPFGLGLNRGAEINTGLDIIKTLREFYGVSVPVFIDNAEAVTKLYEIEGAQTIKLFLSVYAGRLVPRSGLKNHRKRPVC